jgi:hypothetical protein
MQKDFPKKDPPKKRFLSIRLTESELKDIYRQCERSTCRSLTEYAKKVLTRKPVIVRHRNESQDDLLEAMTGIKNRLDQLTEMALEKRDLLLLRELSEIKSLTRQMFEKWSITESSQDARGRKPRHPM